MLYNSHKKLMKKLILSVYYFFIFGAFCIAQNENKWMQDIEYYHKTLEEKHIDLYHTISKEEFNAKIEKLKSNLNKLTGFQIIVELMRLTQEVGDGKSDGHTSVPLWNRENLNYPIKIFDFDGELRVISTDKKNKGLLGKILKSIDRTPIEDVYKKVSELTPFTENKLSSMDRTCSYMMNSEILEAINVTKSIVQAEFKFIDDNGKYESIILKSYNKKTLAGLKRKTLSVLHPDINRPEGSKFKNLWFTSLDNSNTIFINFKKYPSEKDMNEFSESVYNYIEMNKSKNLIIDLRDNYGGDFFMGSILISWLNATDFINWKSKVYVLTNRATYSAAMVNAVQFRQLLNAKVVGEPTGANPNGYQDLGQFNLPNSKLLITYTKRLFRLQNTNTKGVQPDVLITPKWEQYNNGVDEVLNWVLKDLNN